MITRRDFLRVHGGLLLSTLSVGTSMAAQNPPLPALYYPEEGEHHQRTWMAFGASAAIWGHNLLPLVRRDLANIANTIVQYEPVTMLVRPSETQRAKRLLSRDVEIAVTEMDDLWIRDTGPLFTESDSGHVVAVDFNFNGWGNKQRFQQDAKVAAFIAQQSNTRHFKAPIVLEGGCIEVDGQGSAIITESCVLNENRNPGLTKTACEAILKPLLGLDNIIWLPGIRGRDITDGHTDFYARFARPGVVVASYDGDPASFDHAVTKKHLQLLEKATDSAGKPLEIITLDTPLSLPETHAWNDDFAAGYVGYYVCNGAVIMQAFGDKDADRHAKMQLQRAFPEHRIEQISVNGIAAGGGSIHCTTQQQPRFPLA